MALGLKVAEELAAKPVTRTGRHARNLELVEGLANKAKKTVPRRTWMKTSRFAKLVGIPPQYALDHIENGMYTHPLARGAASVQVRKMDAKVGSRRYWRMEFNKAQALELKRRIDKQERDFANGREITETVSRSPAWLSHLFHEKGEKRNDRRILDIEVGGETRKVSLYSLGREEDTFRISFMKRDHLELFAAWVRERGDVHTWNPAEKSEIPGGYITTTKAGRLLGFEKQPDVHIRHRIESEVIKNWQRLQDGRIVVSESEINSLKEIKERMAKTTTKLMPFCIKKLGMAYGQVWTLLREDIAGNQIFVMKKLDGTDATVQVSKDFDGELAILHADAKELKRIHNEREAGLIGKEEAAQILGVSQGTIRRYTDPKTETVGLILEDGKIFTVHAVLDGSGYRFVKKDVQAARTANETTKQAFVGTADITEMTGLAKNTIERLLAENSHVFETKDRHNKVVIIAIQYGKEGKLLVPKKYAKLLADLIIKGEYIPVGFKAKLYGKGDERTESVHMEPFFTRFPDLRDAVVFDPVNERSLLPLFADANITLPLIGENGSLQAAAEDRILVEMYARLFCRPNSEAIEFAETFLKLMRKWDASPLSETQMAAVYTLRQFTNWLKLGNAGDKARELLVKLEKKPFATLMEVEMPKSSKYYDFALLKLIEPIPPRHFWLK